MAPREKRPESPLPGTAGHHAQHFLKTITTLGAPIKFLDALPQDKPPACYRSNSPSVVACVASVKGEAPQKPDLLHAAFDAPLAGSFALETDIWEGFLQPQHLVLLWGPGMVTEPGSCSWLFCFVKASERNVCVFVFWKATDVIGALECDSRSGSDFTPRGPVSH